MVYFIKMQNSFLHFCSRINLHIGQCHFIFYFYLHSYPKGIRNLAFIKNTIVAFINIIMGLSHEIFDLEFFCIKQLLLAPLKVPWSDFYFCRGGWKDSPSGAAYALGSCDSHVRQAPGSHLKFKALPTAFNGTILQNMYN